MPGIPVTPGGPVTRRHGARFSVHDHRVPVSAPAWTQTGTSCRSIPVSAADGAPPSPAVPGQAGSRKGFPCRSASKCRIRKCRRRHVRMACPRRSRRKGDGSVSALCRRVSYGESDQLLLSVLAPHKTRFSWRFRHPGCESVDSRCAAIRPRSGGNRGCAVSGELYRGRTAFAREVCAWFGFVDALGNPRESNSRAALRDLETAGRIRLPSSGMGGVPDRAVVGLDACPAVRSREAAAPFAPAAGRTFATVMAEVAPHRERSGWPESHLAPVTGSQ